MPGRGRRGTVDPVQEAPRNRARTAPRVIAVSNSRKPK
ncbi:hypothetical protein GZL_03217 [Streptomyces sp. 769]|nr:hypothetical protein GZL_03217 [Streptomyces sp. 769]